MPPVVPNPKDPQDGDAGGTPAAREGKPQRKRHPVRRLLKGLMWTVIGLVALLLLAFAFLQTEAGRGVVKGIVQDTLNSTFRGRFEIDHISGLLPFDAQVEGFRVFDPDGQRVLDVQRATANFHPLELLKSRVHLSEIFVERPTVDIFDPQGRLALLRAFELRVLPTDLTPSPWVVELEGVTLDEGTVQGLVAGQDFALNSLTIDLALAIGPQGLRWPKLVLRGRPVGNAELAAVLGGAQGETPAGLIVIASQGELAGKTLKLDSLEVTAGAHALSLKGTIGIDGPLTADVEVLDMRLAVDRLPLDVRQILGFAAVGDLQGRGHVTLDRAGELVLSLALDSPYGLVALQAGAGLRTPDDDMLRLHDWALTLDVVDAAPPPGIADHMPAEARAARADVHVDGVGHGMPLAAGGAVRIEVALDERAPNDTGHLRALLTRIEDDPLDGAPTFQAEVDAESVRLQPWLGIVGEPEIVGMLDVLHADATLALAAAGPPRIALATSFEVEAKGRIAAIDKPFDAPHLAGSATLQWDGGTPSGRIDLSGADLGFDIGGARTLALGFDLRARSDGTPEVAGTLRAEDLHWGERRIATLELPLDLAFEGLAAGHYVPTGRVRWRATGVDLGDQSIASTSGDVEVLAEPDAVRVRGVVRTGALDLGRVVNAGASATDLRIDARLEPGPDGAPVGGPIQVRVSGDLGGVHQGPRHARALRLDDVVVALPRGPAGPIQVTGTTRWSGVVMPEASADSAVIEVDGSFDPRTVTPSGTARIDLVGVVLPNRRRIDTAHVDASATPDGRIKYSGTALLDVSDGKPLPGADGKVEKLEARFSGTAVLPGGKRALVVTLDSLRLRRPGDLEDFLVLDGATYDRNGRVSVSHLVLRQAGKPGVLTIDGSFRPADGAIEATVVASALSIASWLPLLREALGWAGLPPPAGMPTELGGDVEATLHISGTLARPTFSADIAATGINWGEQHGASARLSLRGGEGGIELLAALSWHDGGDLSLAATLPARVSFAPPALVWNDEAPVRLALSLDESDLSQVFAWADAFSTTGTPDSAALRKAAGADDLDGALRLDLLVEGTAAEPSMRLTFVGHPLDIGRWKDGSLTVEGSTRGDATAFRLLMTDAKEHTQAQIDVELPFSLPRALRKSDPIAWVRGELERKQFSVDVDIPRLVIADTPLVSFLPAELTDLAAELDMTMSGTLEHPIVDGTASFTTPEASPVDLGLSIRLSTQSDLVQAYFAASRPNGDPLLDGALALPDFGKILKSPSTLPGLLENPLFSLELESADIAAFDIWELNPSLGNLAVGLFPDGRLMLSASARGSPEGLEGRLVTRIRTITPAGAVPAARADSTALRRNAADDVRLAVLVAPDKMTVSLVLSQDSPSLSPFLAIQASAELGPRQLLGASAKGPLVLANVPLKGRVLAGDFRLEGFATAFRSLLGASGGFLSGDLLISGTLGSPRFEQSLEAQFQPVVVAPLGLSHDYATFKLEFQNGTDWKLTMNEIYDKTRTTTRLPVSRCGVVPGVFGEGVNRVDDTANGYLALSLSGSIPTLDPHQMTLGGCIGLRDFPAAAKRDMHGRIDGELQLGGTIAEPEVRGKITVIDAVFAPNLASKTVRPIGTPLDVTLVRGPPVPPLERPVRNPYQTGVIIDIEVVIPRGSMRLEPSLRQVYGEMRALLYPSGTLRVRTRDGELGLVGTIDVPRETVFLYGKRFNVDKDSRAVFAGDMTSDPQIFFTARYNIEHVDLSSIGLTTTPESEVVVRVTGTPTEPRLAFSSTPAMDETNILSVIALGMPAGGGATVGEAVQGQIFTAIMGMATLQFARDFQRRLALDVLRIEARSADPTESRLTVGKRLTGNLILNYYLDLAAHEGEDVNSGSLEYRLTRYLSILGKAGDSGDVGLELHLRFQD